MFVYKIPPIDYWDGWLSEDEYLARAKAHKNQLKDDIRKSKQESLIKAIQELECKGGAYEGYFLSAIPRGDGTNGHGFLLAWKQLENGSTFVASPYELPWLNGAAEK